MPTITWPDPGELKSRVTVRRWTSAANVDMGITEQFDAGVKRWAKIEPVSGGVYWGAKQISEGFTHRIWLRHGPGTKETDLTGQFVIDDPHKNQRFRVKRSTNVGGADVFTMLEVELLGAIT